MGNDLMELVVIVIIIIIIFIIIAACCKGLRRAYAEHITGQDLVVRRRQAFTNQAGNGGAAQPGGVRRAVRITTISRDGATIAMGVYEIQLPQEHRYGRSQAIVDTSPPPPFSTAYEMSTPTVVDIDEPPPPSYDDYIKYNSASNVQALK